MQIHIIMIVDGRRVSVLGDPVRCTSEAVIVAVSAVSTPLKVGWV